MSRKKTSPLALHGGTPVRSPEKVWPDWPVYDDREKRALMEVLESRTWFYGPRVEQFEKEFAAFQDAQYCVSCNSGTAGLEIALEALDIGQGDEVIVPPYTFVATVSAVSRVGATPIFVDLDKSWCMDPNAAEAAITRRTRAIMPVHFGGRVCDIDRLRSIAQARGVALIEDACHSWGAKWKGKGTGALGLCGIFSFQQSKNMTGGEGGAILTDNEDFAKLCRSIVNCGREAGMPWYHHINVGTNARLTEFQAALLSVQLSRLEEQTLKRERNGALLNSELPEIEGLVPQPSSNRITRRAYHLYCLRIEESAFGCSREKFIEACQAEGLPITSGYPLPLYKQPVFKKLKDFDYDTCHCPVAEDLCYKSGMWILHPVLLTEESDMWDIVNIMRKVKENVAFLK